MEGGRGRVEGGRGRVEGEGEGKGGVSHWSATLQPLALFHQHSQTRPCMPRAHPRSLPRAPTGILERRNIYIKAFHDIPMADLDAVFPDKKFFFKMASLLQILATIATALAALASMMFKVCVRVRVCVCVCVCVCMRVGV